jgi:prepilin-type processing-associated H-X9-DG protein
MGGYSRSRTGLSLVELITLIAIACVLVAILFPVIGGNRHGCGPACLSRLQQLSAAMAMYAQDYDDCYPSYRSSPRNDWNMVSRSADGQGAQKWRNTIPWVAQLFPYVKSEYSFRCPQEFRSEDGQPGAPSLGPSTFGVSYGPNLMFVNPAAYGQKKPVATTGIDEPGEKYLMGDCAVPSGFDLDSIAYLRYARYDPALHQNGWSLDQFLSAGRVARPTQEAEALTRHLGSNVLFADGHVKRRRPDEIPDNDRPYGSRYRELEAHMVPWLAGPTDAAQLASAGVPVGREER